MADAGARRHDAEIVERLLAPAQEGVALAVALELDLDVLVEGRRAAEIVDHHRMVDDQIDRRERVDLLRIAAELDHRLAHRREIDHRRHAGQILHQHARRAEGDLAVRALASSSQAPSALMSSTVTVRPFSSRTRFSSSTFSENGRREMSPSPAAFAAASRLK